MASKAELALSEVVTGAKEQENEVDDELKVEQKVANYKGVAKKENSKQEAAGEIIEQVYGLINGGKIGTNDWALGYCGYEGKIMNSGGTFCTDISCLARVGDNFSMSENTGVYMISWNVGRLDYSRGNGIGICTGDLKEQSWNSQEGWYQSKYHVGWDFGGSWHDTYAPHGLLCGWNNNKNNVLYKSGNFIGTKLPFVNEKNTVSLIYDSTSKHGAGEPDGGILYFKLNDHVLNTKIVAIPNKNPLYWFIAKKNYLMQCTIKKD